VQAVAALKPATRAKPDRVAAPGALDDRAAQFFQDLQDRITAGIEAADSGGRFREDAWTRPTGGGGRTRVLADGKLFEKAGVAFSDVHGTLRPEMSRALPGEGETFRATGISLIFHPKSPRIPTVHANVRHIQRGGAGWFGGGTDLTPYYVVPADAAHFHRTLRDACARHDATFYPRFKRWCDDYFFLAHRKTNRAASAVAFFDYLGAGAEATAGQSADVPSPRESDP
jgi:coproporphyrinogen III oxidase